MSKNFKIKLFKGITQFVGCITILNYLIKCIRCILTNYWPIVELSYLAIAETTAFIYMSIYIGSYIYKQYKQHKDL